MPLNQIGKKPRVCKADGCDNVAIGIVRYCSYACKNKSEPPKKLKAKTESKLKRRAIKVKAKSKPNAAQKAIHDRLREMGCSVGKFVYGKDGTPPDIHHITVSGRRLGESFVIPLSPQVHRQGTPEYPSIHSVNGGHGGKKAFKAAYGFDEFELLELCEKELGVKYSEAVA